MKDRKHFEKRLEALRTRQKEFVPHWRELSEYILPRRGRFLASTSDYGKGSKINGKIKDATGTRALRTLSAGMMAGMTSPARPWFRLALPDPEMSEYDPVKDWLSTVAQRMRQVFASSNLYNVLPIIYEEQGLFGTAAMLLVEDVDTVIRCYAYTAGEYMIALNDKNTVDVCYREVPYTVDQLVQWFGIENVSDRVRDMHNKGQYDEPVMVVHAIEPNHDHDPKSVLSAHKPYTSVWYEKTCKAGENKFLSRKGFDSFPVMAPRWHATSSDPYGRSPGMDALPDVKQLQVQVKEKGTAIAMNNKPPMVAPPELRNKRKSLIPGGVTYLAATPNGQKFERAFESNLPIRDLVEDIRETQVSIERTFYSDLFAMISNLDRRQITAREIDERHEEKLLQLGPVLERIQHELLDPIIDRTFEIMLSRGMIPVPPEEMQGMPIKVDYISMLAQAQRAVGTTSVDRLVGFAGNLAAIGRMDALDKLDVDYLLEDYGDMLGTNPRALLPDDKVEEIRAQRAQAQQLAQQQEMLARAASGAEQLSRADTSGKNALTDMMAAQGAA